MQDTDTFRADTRAWLQANCPESMRQPITPDEMVWSGSSVRFGSEDQRLWFERMRDRGWFAPGWPAALGGGGLPPRQARIVEEEMLRLGCRQPQFNLGVWMLGPVLLELGTEAQKQEHLVPMMQGAPAGARASASPMRALTWPASRPPRASRTTATSSSTARKSGRLTAMPPTGCTPWCAPTPRRASKRASASC